jgi:catechol 2,3-dioxygenase-like lactoylglutathione lyase family enzyme
VNDRFDHIFIAPEDFDSSLAFYRDVLRWNVVASWGGNGESRGVVLSGGGIKAILAERHASKDRAWTHGVNGTRPNIHLDIHDIAKRFASIPPGDHVVIAPEATRWGSQWFVVRDPDGNLIAFEETRPKP